MRLASDVLVAAVFLALFGLIAWILPAIGEPIGRKECRHKSVRISPTCRITRCARCSVCSWHCSSHWCSRSSTARRPRAAAALSRVLIPLLDILQSVPILGFLSATITIWMVLFPGSMLGVEAASIFAIFTSQAWNMGVLVHPVPDQRTN